MPVYKKQAVTNPEQYFGEPVSVSGSTLKFRCPACKKKALCFSKSRGVFRCFYCRYNQDSEDTVFDFVATEKKFLIDFELHKAVSRGIIEVSKLTEDFRSFLRDRFIANVEDYSFKTSPFFLDKRLMKLGFTQEDLVESGLFYIDDQEILRPRRNIKSGVYLIPYWSGQTIMSIKARLNSVEAMASGQKYYISKGFLSSKHLFYHNPGRGDLYVTEGELQSITLQNIAGGTSSSIPGLGCFDTASKHAPKLHQEAKLDRTFICLDPDEGYTESKAHAMAIDHICRSFNDECGILYPPVLEQQIDSWLIQNGPEAFDHLKETAWRNRRQEQEKWRRLLV